MNDMSPDTLFAVLLKGKKAIELLHDEHPGSPAVKIAHGRGERLATTLHKMGLISLEEFDMLMGGGTDKD